MHFDEIPKLPDIKKLGEIEEEQALTEFREAKNKFMFYEKEAGDIRLLFNKMDAATYACLVAKLSHPFYKDVFEFWKLVAESARLLKTNTKKGIQVAEKIEKCL